MLLSLSTLSNLCFYLPYKKRIVEFGEGEGKSEARCWIGQKDVSLAGFGDRYAARD